MKTNLLFAKGQIPFFSGLSLLSLIFSYRQVRPAYRQVGHARFVRLLLLLAGGLASLNVSAQNFQWAKAMGGTGWDYGHSIALDGSGNVYTIGYFEGTVDFDPGAGTFNLTSAGNNDIFISKLDANGNFVWAKAMGGTGWDEGRSIALDGSGNVYTTGLFQGTVDFDPGAGTFNLISAGLDDIFISKLDANGNFVWAKAMGGTNSDFGHSIALDGSGNVYTTGSFQGTVDFDPGAGTFNLTSAGLEDIFISKLDANGNFLWAKAMGGTNLERGLSIALDGSGNVYTTGFFQGTVDFDPGAGVFNLTSAGGTDIFVHKMYDPPTGIANYDLENQLSIYPNPSSGLFNLKMELPTNIGMKMQSIEVYNVYGEKVTRSVIPNGVRNLTIDLSSQPSGIYLINLQTNEGTATKKLIIQK